MKYGLTELIQIEGCPSHKLKVVALGPTISTLSLDEVLISSVDRF